MNFLTKIRFIKSLVLLIIACCTMQANAQTYWGTPNTIITKASILAASPATTNVTYRNFNLDNRIDKAELFVRFKSGQDEYALGKIVWGYTITFDIEAQTLAGVLIPGVFSSTSQTIHIDENKPEVVYYRNFTQWTTASAKIGKVVVSNITLTPDAGNPAAIQTTIENSLVLDINYAVNYGVDVRNASAFQSFTITPQTAQLGSRLATFSWNNGGHEYQNYQFQLLRLRNTSTLTMVSENIITSEIDWSGALNIETEDKATTMTLHIAEGTGFYVWRVRPIGTYYPGGATNYQNWGQWTNAITSGTVSLGLSSLTGSTCPYFFYTDPDADKNWIFSRTFNEGNKKNEQISYANGLQHITQSQAYIQSEQTTVVSSTVNDNTGRPSLTSLPVPVNGNLSGYKNDFMLNTASPTPELYTADDFDENSNFTTPSIVSENTGAFDYYSGNTDRVADAKGYPYSRVIYYNDGTNRVKEISSPGFAHSLGLQTGQNHTTRTYYDSPSDMELIRLFGDEAPDASSVLKTITFDANNTASVTYTFEGHTIATALAFSPNENTALVPLDETGLDINVCDDVTGKVKVGDGYVTTKRITLTLASNTLTVSYHIDCDNVEAMCADGTCGYTLAMRVFNIDNPGVDLLNFTSQTVCGASGVEDVGPYPISGLPPGTYIIEKIITPTGVTIVPKEGNGPDGFIAMVQNWICTQHLDQEVYEGYLNNFPANVPSADITTYFSGSAYPDGMPMPSSVSLIYNSNGDPVQIAVSTPCCPYSVTAIGCSTEKSLCDVDPGTGHITPHFEQYLMDAVGPASFALNFTSNFCPGYQIGQFDQMVTHMLNDVYSCEGTTDCNGNPITAAPMVQYTCPQLELCWKAIVHTYEDVVDGLPSGSHVEDGADGDDQDDESGNETGPSSLFDLPFNDNSGGIDWLNQFISGLLGNWMRGEDADYQYNMVTPFLQCAGNKFAKIILNPDCYSCITPSTTPDDFIPLTTDQPEYNNTLWGGGTSTAIPMVTHPDNTTDPVYPYIKNPVFAFKYFEYTCGDNSTCEELYNFYGPSTVTPATAPCYSGTTCQANVADWSCSMRGSFYECIKNSTESPQITPPPEACTTCSCAVANYNQALPGVIDNCETSCDNKAGDFKQAIIAALQASCYVIVECPANPDANAVTMADIDKMVAELVAQCKLDCQLPELTSSDCNQITCTKTYPICVNKPDLVVTYPELILNKCAQLQYQQAMAWGFELDIKSICPADYSNGDPLTGTYIGAARICTDGLSPSPQCVNGEPVSTDYSEVKHIVITTP